MEYTKQLTIEEVKIGKTGTNKKGSWTLYRVKASGEYYSAFNLNLAPGMTATFQISEAPGEKTNPATGKPYINKTIESFVGAADSVRTPARATQDADPALAPATLKDLAALELKLFDTAQSPYPAPLMRTSRSGSRSQNSPARSRP